MRSYDAIKSKFGERGVMDLVGAVGYYSIVSMVLNVAQFEIAAPARRRRCSRCNRHGRRASEGRSAQASGSVARQTSATTMIACVGPIASPTIPYSTGAIAPPPIVPV